MRNAELRTQSAERRENERRTSNFERRTSKAGLADFRFQRWTLGVERSTFACLFFVLHSAFIVPRSKH